MTKEHKLKMQNARAKKSESKTLIEIDNIVIKSHDHGWILNIGNEDSRYYSNLSQLFKKLFDIKLSRSHIDTLQQVISQQKVIFSELETIGDRIERMLSA